MATPGRYNLRARKGAAGAGAAVVNTPPPAPGTEAHADTAVDRSGAAHAAPAPARKGAGSAPNADGGDDSNTTKPVLLPAGDPAWSSGVPFYPPSERYWRIGNKWYDFTDFLAKHPGGAEALTLSRDRFEDATFVFESHHHNYTKARAIIRKYEVPEATVIAAGLRSRPPRDDKSQTKWGHHDKVTDLQQHPDLMGDDSFYSVLRKRVSAHLKSVGCKDGGPTWQCVILFWLTFAAWCTGQVATWSTGSVAVAAFTGLLGSWLGAFGHNWVHQPKYRGMWWAILSLDTLGFSSEGWYREHNLQHHMYTNTPWDNHFRGTDPFLVTDPTVERNWLQRTVMPYALHVILVFGVYGNWVAHLGQIVSGEENVSIGKCLMPLHVLTMVWTWGLYGLALAFAHHAVIGTYYFTLALMNHNSERSMDVKGRNAAKDWGHAQLHSSADWGVDLSFLQASKYLWLNFHTVHHLFPRVDFSHHPSIQGILIETCKEFDIEYTTASSPFEIYKQMLHGFANPRSLMQEIIVYSGGI